MAYKLQDTLQLLSDAAIDCEPCFACPLRLFVKMHKKKCSFISEMTKAREMRENGEINVEFNFFEKSEISC